MRTPRVMSRPVNYFDFTNYLTSFIRTSNILFLFSVLSWNGFNDIVKTFSAMQIYLVVRNIVEERKKREMTLLNSVTLLALAIMGIQFTIFCFRVCASVCMRLLSLSPSFFPRNVLYFV